MNEEQINELIKYNLEYFNETLTDEQIANSILDKTEFTAKLEEKDKEIERLSNIIDEKSKIVYELRTYIEHNLFKYFDDEKKYKKCRNELYKIIF